MLLRKRLAVPVFLASLVALSVTSFYNYGLSVGLEVAGDAGSVAFTAVIFVIALAPCVHSLAMQKRGVLV